MRIIRKSIRANIIYFRELSLCKSWFVYMAPTLTQAVRYEC